MVGYKLANEGIRKKAEYLSQFGFNKIVIGKLLVPRI